MKLLPSILGGTFGLGVQLYSNLIRKVPASRQPWLHVTFTLLGIYGGNKWVEHETQLVVEINEDRARHGLPPLVGTVGWIRYEFPDDKIQ